MQRVQSILFRVTLKGMGEVNLTHPLVFFFEKEGKVMTFVAFNIIKRHIFPENFIKILQVVQKI